MDVQDSWLDIQQSSCIASLRIDALLLNLLFFSHVEGLTCFVKLAILPDQAPPQKNYEVFILTGDLKFLCRCHRLRRGSAAAMENFPPATFYTSCSFLTWLMQLQQSRPACKPQSLTYPVASATLFLRLSSPCRPGLFPFRSAWVCPWTDFQALTPFVFDLVMPLDSRQPTSSSVPADLTCYLQFCLYCLPVEQHCSRSLLLLEHWPPACPVHVSACFLWFACLHLMQHLEFGWVPLNHPLFHTCRQWSQVLNHNSPDITVVFAPVRQPPWDYSVSHYGLSKPAIGPGLPVSLMPQPPHCLACHLHTTTWTCWFVSWIPQL